MRNRQEGTRHLSADEVIQAISKCTYPVLGKAFFRSLVLELAPVLRTRFAFVGQLLRNQTGRVRTVAICADGVITDDIEYNLKGTPCESIVGKRLRHYPRDARKLFPQDSLLAELKVESFMGTPLFSASGKPIGLLAVLDDRPMAGSDMAQTVLNIFAARAAAELERFEAEAARQESERRFRHAQKMEAMGYLAGGMAHDFNNILSVILGYAELTLTDRFQDDPLREDIQQIFQAAERGRDLIRQLMAFGRKQVLEFQLVNLNDVVQGMGKLLQRLIGENIEIVNHLSPCAGLVNADPSQIEQVVMNLAVNARDAMPQGGKLILTITNAELDENYTLAHPEVTPGCYVMLAVSDTGCGMSPEVQQRIFEPYFTTKEKGKGTGLGLSTVYGIVKQHGGEIVLYSEPEIGTTFKIYLPRAAGTIQARPETAKPVSTTRGHERIMVVEDDSSLRKLICAILNQQGYTVIAAANGKETGRLASEITEPIQLLIADVVMPGMNGPEVYDQLRTVWNTLKVLYISGYEEGVISGHGISYGSNSFLQKPFSAKDLMGKVREILDQGATRS